MLSKRQDFKITLLRDPAHATRMTCREADCPNEANGWAVVIDPTDEKLASAARWIEGDSGRKYLKLRSEDALDEVVNHGGLLGLTLTAGLLTLLRNTPAGMIVFLFPPGQQCFKPHLDREVVFAHQRGERSFIHERPLDFNEDFNIEADKINRALRRG